MKQQNRKQRKKKAQRLSRFLCGVIAICFAFIPAFAFAAPTTSARAFALMERDTSRLLLAKNEHEKLPMASTTKIMTLILAMEYGNPEDIVTVSKNAAGLEGSSMYLKAGETLSLRDLTYGLMLASGNDAAMAIAEHIGGSVEGFAEMMNEKAKEIGATESHFVTPNGLPNDDHYTTAYDLALISAYAMKKEAVRKIVATKSIDLPGDADSPTRYLRSKNKILSRYEGGNGIKTGFTKKAGKCLSAGALREDMQLIAVVLNDYDMFSDCEALLDYGFSTYSREQVAKSGEPMGEVLVNGGVRAFAKLALKEDIYLPLSDKEGNIVERKLFIAEEVKAPVVEGKTAGRVEFYLEGEKLASSDILFAESIEENTFSYHLIKILKDYLGLL